MTFLIHKMYNLIQLHKKDNISVAPMSIPTNVKINSLITINPIPFGHKIALNKIQKDEYIYKYGQIIGIASQNILPGEHVHSHNLKFTEITKFSTLERIKFFNQFVLKVYFKTRFRIRNFLPC